MNLCPCALTSFFIFLRRVIEVVGSLKCVHNLSLEKRVALSTPLHYTLLPHRIPPRGRILHYPRITWEGIGREGRRGRVGAEGSVEVAYHR